MAESDGTLVVGQDFGSFADFETYLKDYSERTKQFFCVSTSRSVEVYNKVHAKQLPAHVKYAYQRT